ncbi:hypothetical protein KCU81_g1874, partial [Aureobasidium melanogenum]
MRVLGWSWFVETTLSRNNKTIHLRFESAHSSTNPAFRQAASLLLVQPSSIQDSPGSQRLAMLNSTLNRIMNDFQLILMSSRGAARTRSLHFLDLPEEIRMMIYRYALRRSRTNAQNSFPALLAVNRQIREEASPTFYRVNRFLLNLQPQPHTTSVELGFDSKTHEWLALIGPKHISNLRRVAFSFPATKFYHFEHNEYHINLSRRDAGPWRFTINPGPEKEFRSLQGDIDEAEDYTYYAEIVEFLRSTGLPIPNAVIDDFMQKAIKRYENALRRSQRVMDEFSDLCGEGKVVKPTIEGLEMIGRGLMAVEQARFGHADY